MTAPVLVVEEELIAAGAEVVAEVEDGNRMQAVAVGRTVAVEDTSAWKAQAPAACRFVVVGTAALEVQMTVVAAVAQVAARPMLLQAFVEES